MQSSPSQDGDDELIPTAIVIKNIPFAVKKEQLVQLMTELNLPLPYAFNYHFDNGVFRGLAFANFTSSEETATVIDMLNHFELQGRKLRVEYKKMLPLQERERIEREKRERRGQLEEQHRPIASSQLQTQSSMSSLASHIPATSPSPVSQRGPKIGIYPLVSFLSRPLTCPADVDLNDSQTLQFYSQMLLFKEDMGREALIFPSNLTPVQRRTVHTLAHNMGLGHASRGTGEQRQVHVFRPAPGTNVSPPLSSIPATVHATDASRRGLNRAATIDFGEARSEGPGHFSTMRGQSSAFLGVLESPGGFGNSQNLRAAKSFADLRSYTPSPVPSSASFPATLQTNGARLQQGYDGTTSGTSNTPTLTPTPPGALGIQREDGLLVNSLGGLSIGTSLGGPSGSPRRLRGMFSWEQENQGVPAGAIGSNRSIGIGFDNQSQERLPVRQPRGPAPERGTGFRRQNGHQARGSDELRTGSGVEIIVE
jgi:R3H domain/RNA recognition motif. (a.k.a. RRM, RBD, or RNP domain)